MVKEDRIWTVPNVLSVFRLMLLIPILIFMAQEKRILAVGLMLLGVATDFIDGYIARRWDQKSNLGRLMDPAIDKINILVITAYMIRSPLYDFPLWFFLFVFAREIILMLGGLLVVKRRNLVMESNRPGKNSAFAVVMGVLLFVLDLQPFGWIMLWIAFVLTLYSSWVYFRSFVRQLKQQTSMDSD